MDLGAAIKKCRTARKFTQQHLADRAGISLAYVSVLENNRRDPTLSTITNVATALGVPVEILFFLAADYDQLVGMDRELANALSRTALTILAATKE